MFRAALSGLRLALISSMDGWEKTLWQHPDSRRRFSALLRGGFTLLAKGKGKRKQQADSEVALSRVAQILTGFVITCNPRLKTLSPCWQAGKKTLLPTHRSAP